MRHVAADWEGPDTYMCTCIYICMYIQGDAPEMQGLARMSVSSVMHKCMHDLYIDSGERV